MPVWDAIGPHHPPRTLAQASNVIWPTARLYERLWRVRSLSLLSGRAFPNHEELQELTAAVSSSRGSASPLAVDVGCSEGLYARHLAAEGWDVVAVDHARPFLAAAARRIVAQPDIAKPDIAKPDIAERVALVRATAQALPLQQGCADAVVIGGSLNEIGDAGAALREAARVLRKGGVLFSMQLVGAHGRLGRAVQRALGITGIRFYDEEATTRLLGPDFEVESFRLDGIVARVTARRAGISGPVATA